MQHEPYSIEGPLKGKPFFGFCRPTVRFERGENCIFLNGRFFTSYCVERSVLRFLAPAHFGDLELTRTKNGFPDIPGGVVLCLFSSTIYYEHRVYAVANTQQHLVVKTKGELYLG